ncbi:MAG: YraN family protein [Bacteroidetes bacterium SB0662_bin_6]|nr:YraN family protein [Bacteroidetes bacterium SB0668_bin_1]MYE03803.1 YraN family protein [Bacteroidetes bacterium SB0662_bin_6]
MSERGKDVGKRGEDIAAAYLESIGYHILHRNYRFGRLEIDLVCCEPSGDDPDAVSGQGEIVFAEVKTRSGLRFGRPEEAISETKQRRIAQAAQAWLRERSMGQAPCRFDVIAVVLHKNADPIVTHFKQAFWTS